MASTKNYDNYNKLNNVSERLKCSFISKTFCKLFVKLKIKLLVQIEIIHNLR